MPHLCFYSERCRFSQSFIEELKRTPYFSEFKLICVDPDGSGKRLPIVDKGRTEKWLTAVPTLIIDGESGPRTDAEVFNWLSMKKLQEGSRQQSGVPGPQAVEGGEPAAYGNEMTSNKWSDSYSFFNESFDVSKGTGYDPIPRTFAQLDGNGFGSAMPQTGSSTAAAPQQRSKKEMAMDRALEDFQKTRNSDFPVSNRK
jgi:hypothetical protein